MKLGRMLPPLFILVALIGVPAALLTYHASRTNTTVRALLGQIFSRAVPDPTEMSDLSPSQLPKGKKIDFLTSRQIGRKADPASNPIISHLRPVDLDQDGLLDTLVCDVREDQVNWIRQAPAGTFTEHGIGTRILAPGHAEPVDIDGDGDLDVLVASMGMIYANNDRVGSVVILENDGEMSFTNHVVIARVARVVDARAGDLDGDGDLDIALAHFGYDDGETTWLENHGDWTFESHLLQTLSGPINSEIVDIDGDGDGDILVLVSQQWEEIYIHVNDGRGNFEQKMIYGSSNEDFGSSWVRSVDLDQDGDMDIVYSNGDAFDYIPPRPRPWHGVQWLENLGGLNFKGHRIADFAGASSPVPVDVDGDGDIDIAVCSAYNLWDKPTAQSLIWLENNGKQQFTRHDIASNPTHLVTLGAGDFTGDGRPDFVTGGIYVYPPYDRMARVTLWTNEWGSIPTNE